MKKIIISIFFAALVLGTASGYNPPTGSENLFTYSSPNGLSGNLSVTGGALFSSGADSVIVNPALAAGNQRVSLNAGFTFLHNYNTSNFKAGSAFQAGILIPTKMFVFSGYVNGTFLPFPVMNVGNSINIKAGLSKEITDKLDVGLSLNSGVAWNDGLDWSLSGNIGFNYNYGDLWIFKDFRYGASILNLGKNYTLKNSIGTNYKKESTHFPGIATLKIGASGTLFNNDFLKIGAALDLSTTYFMNLIVDANFQFLFNDMISISIGETVNIAESVFDNWSAVPSVSVGVKFALDVKNNQYLSKNGWDKSEMTISTGYRNLYNSINAYSAGAVVDLGMRDTTPPVIEILD